MARRGKLPTGRHLRGARQPADARLLLLQGDEGRNLTDISRNAHLRVKTPTGTPGDPLAGTEQPVRDRPSFPEMVL